VSTLTPLDLPHVVEDRMAALRAQLRREAQACHQARERWTDWRTHVQAHPWLACGLAAAVGYAFVPNRRSNESMISAAPLTAPSIRAPRSSGILGRLATEAARRAAQQAMAVGAAWALARFRAAQQSPGADQNGHGGVHAYAESPYSSDYTP
jgi:hypothetical protein